MRKRAAELDAVKAHYILSEKAILEVLNRCRLESAMMVESLEELCSQMRQAYRSVCDVLQEMSNKLNGDYRIRCIQARAPSYKIVIAHIEHYKMLKDAQQTIRSSAT